MMRYWKGKAAVICFSCYKHTRSWYEKIEVCNRNLNPLWLISPGVVIFTHYKFQSYAYMTIYHAHDRTFEGSSSCELLELVQTYLILVWNVAIWVSPHLSSPSLVDQKQVMVTIIGNEFQSQPRLTIHYTNDETLEGSCCCGLLELVQTHSILV